MGFIPLFLLIAGFSFLWGSVNYNSLKSRRDLLTKKLDRIREATAERNRLIQALLNEVPPTQLGELNIHFFESINSYSISNEKPFIENERKAKVWVAALVRTLKENGSNTSLDLLEIASGSVSSSITEYVATAQEYNQLVSEKPSAFIATWLGFKVVPLN